MERVIDGKGNFSTPDGLSISVLLAVVFGDGPPRIEIESIKNPGNLIPVQAVDRAAKVFLFELTTELRKAAYRQLPCRSDPKPKDEKVRRVRVAR